MSEYQQGALLRKVRAQISKYGNSEANIADADGVKALFDQLQDLRDEMNEAKKAAAAEAAKPYLELMERIEKQYAMILKLSASR